MKRTLLFLYKICYFFIPIPIFLDFGNLSIINHNVDEFNFLLDRPQIPFPIGGIFLFLSIIIGYIYSLMDAHRMQSIFKPSRLISFYIFFVTPFVIYCLFISELSLPRTIQMVLPIFILSTVCFPKLTLDRLDIFKYTLYGSSIFFFLHLFSIISYADDILDVNDAKEFSSFYGLLIYQSLVAYPGVISLYLFLSLAIIYIKKKQKISFPWYYNYLSLTTPLALLYLLAASGRRAFIIEISSSALIIVFFSILFIIKKGGVKTRSVLYLLTFFISSFILSIFYIYSSLSNRVTNSIRDNTFDSGRSDKISQAYAYFTKNIDVLLLGAGGSESPGFHNYFFDQIYRIGLFGFIPLYLSITLLFLRFKKINDLGTPYKDSRLVFISIIFSCGFWQSVINTSISQPYYFINFFITAVLLYFTLFSFNTNNINAHRYLISK